MAKEAAPDDAASFSYALIYLKALPWWSCFLDA